MREVFNGTRYHVKTLYNEALILPSRRAMEIKEEGDESATKKNLIRAINYYQ